MDQFKRSGELAVESTRVLFYHPCSVFQSEVPTLASGLFLRDVRAGHLEDGLPGTFNQTVGGLKLGWGGDDIA